MSGGWALGHHWHPWHHHAWTTAGTHRHSIVASGASALRPDSFKSKGPGGMAKDFAVMLAALLMVVVAAASLIAITTASQDWGGRFPSPTVQPAPWGTHP